MIVTVVGVVSNHRIQGLDKLMKMEIVAIVAWRVECKLREGVEVVLRRTSIEWNWRKDEYWLWRIAKVIIAK